MAKARKGSAGPGLRLAAVDGAAVAGAGMSAGREPKAIAHEPEGPLHGWDATAHGWDPTDGRPLTAAECALMHDGTLGYLRGVLTADLAVVEAEHRARQELAEHLAKRLRRTIVDARLPRVPGEVLTAEAGNEFSYVYSGTPWKLTTNSARQRGLPEALVGKMVCYAWGKPLLEEGRPPPAAAAALRRDADEEDIPF